MDQKVPTCGYYERACGGVLVSSLFFSPFASVQRGQSEIIAYARDTCITSKLTGKMMDGKVSCELSARTNVYGTTECWVVCGEGRRCAWWIEGHGSAGVGRSGEGEAEAEGEGEPKGSASHSDALPTHCKFGGCRRCASVWRGKTDPMLAGSRAFRSS